MGLRRFNVLFFNALSPSQIVSHIETGAGFRRELAVSVYRDARIAFCQFPDEAPQGFALPVRTRVGRIAVAVESPYIAYPYRPAVVARTVGSGFAFVASRFDGPVERYHIVVADLAESAFAVPAVDVGRVEIHSPACRRAVDYDHVNASHRYPLSYIPR